MDAQRQMGIFHLPLLFKYIPELYIFKISSCESKNNFLTDILIKTSLVKVYKTSPV